MNDDSGSGDPAPESDRPVAALLWVRSPPRVLWPPNLWFHSEW